MNALEFFSNVKTATQVKIFNEFADKPVKRFSDRPTGGKRIVAALADFDEIDTPAGEIEVSELSAGVIGGINTILLDNGDNAIPVSAQEKETALDGAIAVEGVETLQEKPSGLPAPFFFVEDVKEEKSVDEKIRTAKVSGPNVDVPKLPKPGTKKRIVFDLACREKGVTKTELSEATGWPRANATLGRVVKAAGYVLERGKRPNGDSQWKAVKPESDKA
ncbi:hypothetical protein [uncultured Roseibium sp.]|uniref:hypothetical protein n=1 Tax=uncultured Roseibium sp. TaxID=1936171 RepID=UPI0026275400|nr:hypothetical protein [uncultured Roseibium sp.]